MPLIVLTAVIAVSENKKAVSKSRKNVFCPACKSQLIERVHRPFFVKTLLFWLPLKRYICFKCKRKIYKLD